MKSFSKGKSFGGGDRRGGDRFGGKKEFGGRPSFGGPKPWEKNDRGFGGDRARAEMHPAVCGDCGKSCEVPFRPSGDKPVYCSDCFGGNKSDDRGSRDSRGGGSFERRDFAPKRSFDRPAPSFDRGGNNNNDQVGKQLEAMNAKLDRLVDAMKDFVNTKASVSAPAASVAPKAVETPKASAPVAAKKAVAPKKAPVAKKAAAKTAPKKAATKKVAAKKAVSKKK